jgi:hypothetical protein
MAGTDIANHWPVENAGRCRKAGPVVEFRGPMRQRPPPDPIPPPQEPRAMFIRTSTAAAPWAEVRAFSTTDAPDVALGAVRSDNWLGFGGCFNERGWQALSHLDDPARDRVLRDLFAEDGLALSCNRLPIGANDPDTDYGMERFSIARDHKALIPYTALRRRRGGVTCSFTPRPGARRPG